MTLRLLNTLVTACSRVHGTRGTNSLEHGKEIIAYCGLELGLLLIKARELTLTPLQFPELQNAGDPEMIP